MDWDFSMSGYELRSSAKASVKDGRIEGEYRTRVRDEGTTIDEGKFEANQGL